MSQLLKAVRDDVRKMLQDYEDTANYRWTDIQLNGHIQRVVRDVSAVVPLGKKTALTVIADLKDLDISSLSNLIRVDRVEFKIDQSVKRWRNFSIRFADTLTMGIDFNPDATEEGTLAGTVTFTEDSTAITGSGTAFDTVLSVGDFIRKSTGAEWYEIASIELATALTLATASNDTGVDVVDSTLYGSEPAYIYWSAEHTLTALASTLPATLERLVIWGATCQASIAWAQRHINEVMAGGQSSPQNMLTWGQNQLALFYRDLERFREVRTTQIWPRSA